MDTSLEKIIEYINRHVQGYYYGTPQHSADTHLDSRIGHGYQLVFGVSNTDPMASDVRFYEHRVIDELGNQFPRPNFLPFPYTDENKLKEVLQGLSEEYDAALNIDRLIRDIKFKDDRLIYIIVTVIKFPIILPIED